MVGSVRVTQVPVCEMVQAAASAHEDASELDDPNWPAGDSLRRGCA
jgi:hypothetical protein